MDVPTLQVPLPAIDVRDGEFFPLVIMGDHSEWSLWFRSIPTPSVIRRGRLPTGEEVRTAVASTMAALGMNHQAFAAVLSAIVASATLGDEPQLQANDDGSSWLAAGKAYMDAACAGETPTGALAAMHQAVQKCAARRAGGRDAA